MDTSSIKADGSLTITLPAYSMVVIRMGK
jgi:hypothetical protein